MNVNLLQNSDGARKPGRGEIVLLLGASGYVGRTFAAELRRRGRCFIPLTRRAFDYTRFDFLFDYLRTMRPAFLINAANYESPVRGMPAEGEREKMMAANAILPQMIARACLMTKTPWAHVSSGTVFSGGKIVENGQPTLRRDLDEPVTLRLFNSHPKSFRGFTELDEPNLSFQTSSCDFYTGTKALGEEAVKDVGQSYLWRLRMPFNDRTEPCNWLWRMQRLGRVRDGIHSLTHIEDGVKACLDLSERGAPFGAYNVINPGAVTMSGVSRLMRQVLGVRIEVETVGDDPMPSGCLLDCGKLLHAGIKIRPVEEALQECMGRWCPPKSSVRRWDDVPQVSRAAVL